MKLRGTHVIITTINKATSRSEGIHTVKVVTVVD